MKIGVGILGVALVATLGDYTWYTLNVRHSIATGIIHGAVLLTAVGAVLGLDAGRVLKGLPIGTLRASAARSSITCSSRSWIGGPMERRFRPPGRDVAARRATRWPLAACTSAAAVGQILTRGVLAAVLSGIAFFLVLNTLSGRPPATGKNYFVQFAAWVVAWAPVCWL